MKTPIILICVALMIIGARQGKPDGWGVLALAVISLLMICAGWPHW